MIKPHEIRIQCCTIICVLFARKSCQKKRTVPYWSADTCTRASHLSLSLRRHGLDTFSSLTEFSRSLAIWPIWDSSFITPPPPSHSHLLFISSAAAPLAAPCTAAVHSDVPLTAEPLRALFLLPFIPLSRAASPSTVRYRGNVRLSFFNLDREVSAHRVKVGWVWRRIIEHP